MVSSCIVAFCAPNPSLSAGLIMVKPLIAFSGVPPKPPLVEDDVAVVPMKTIGELWDEYWRTAFRIPIIQRRLNQQLEACIECRSCSRKRFVCFNCIERQNLECDNCHMEEHDIDDITTWKITTLTRWNCHLWTPCQDWYSGTTFW